MTLSTSLNLLSIIFVSLAVAFLLVSFSGPATKQTCLVLIFVIDHWIVFISLFEYILLCQFAYFSAFSDNVLCCI